MSSAKPGTPKRQAAPKRQAVSKRPPAARRAGAPKRRAGGRKGGFSRALVPLVLVALGLGLVIYLGARVPATPAGTQPAATAPGGAAVSGGAQPPAPSAGAPTGGTPKPSTPPVTGAPKSSPDTTPDAKVKTDHTPPEAAPVLYLVSDSQGEQHLVAMPAPAAAPAGADLKVLVTQLVQKGDNANPGSGIPKGTVVKDVTAKNGVAYVNLSGAITHLVGAAAAKKVEYSLVYTLTSQGLGVQKVQLEFDGKPALLDEMDWSAPKGRTDLR